MAAEDGWEAVKQEDVFGTAHVLPIKDLIMHEFENCVCMPKIEPVPGDDGSMGWLIKHNSLDRREDDEDDCPIVSPPTEGC